MINDLLDDKMQNPEVKSTSRGARAQLQKQRNLGSNQRFEFRTEGERLRVKTGLHMGHRVTPGLIFPRQSPSKTSNRAQLVRPSKIVVAIGETVE